MVSPEELLARARDGRVKALQVAGLDLHIRKFSLPEFLDMQKRIASGANPSLHEYLAIGLCHPDGSPFLTVEQAEAFANDDGVLTAIIVDRISEHAGLTPAAQERIAKN